VHDNTASRSPARRAALVLHGESTTMDATERTRTIEKHDERLGELRRYL
jgi:hypothetical protein